MPSTSFSFRVPYAADTHDAALLRLEEAANTISEYLIAEIKDAPCSNHPIETLVGGLTIQGPATRTDFVELRLTAVYCCDAYNETMLHIKQRTSMKLLAEFHLQSLD